MSKANIKIKLASLLLIFGFAFGMATDVTSNFEGQSQTTTAQASTKVTASQAKQIAKINSSLSKTQKKKPKTGLPTANLATTTLLVTETVTVATSS